MRKLLKRITALTSAVSVFTSIIAFSGVMAAENGNVLDIMCEDGYVAVKGSFEADEMINKEYKIIVGAYDENDRLTDSWSSDEYTVKSGSNTFDIKTDIKGDDQMVKAFVWTNELCPLCDHAEAEIKSLKVLAIGNSFSEDSMQWLYNIAQSKGYNNIMLANAYIGGCSLQTHYNNSISGSGAYTYQFNNSGEWQSSSGKSLEYCVKAEDWDLITLQQASGSSGMPETYEPYLTNLIEYVNNTKTNPKAMLAWHMTWAYSQNSTHGEYYKYNNDQMTMYNAIVSATQNKVLPHDELSFVIPTGTAIQNIRSSAIGDSLNRDGFHLDYLLGRYVAGLTWFAAITGESIDDITYVPDTSAIPSHYLTAVKEGVNNAINTPYSVTQSQYTDLRPEAMYDLDKYEQIDWEPLGSSYYNSSVNSTRNTTTNSSASNLKYYISSKMFAKDELPVGTLIVIDSGYQYRPEGWETLDKVTLPRKDNVTAQIVEVTDSWWGVYNYRAFNISVIGANTDISGKTAETAAHFRIYVPKDVDYVTGFEDFYENMEGSELKHIDYNELKTVGETTTVDDYSTGLSVPENGEQSDLVYKKTDTRELMLSFLPPTVKKYDKAPLYFIIPGGGWYSEGRASMIAFSQASVNALRNEGFAVVSIDYRTTQNGAVMSEIIADCFDALTYTAHFADTLGIDKDRIAVSGHSAGAHLALMLAYAPRSEFDDGYVFNDTYTVKAAAPMSAPTILYDDKAHNLKSNLAAAFNGCDTYEERVRTSPITYVSTRSPSTLLCAGTKDNLVYAVSSKQVYNKLKAHNVYAELLLSEGGGHSFEQVDSGIVPSISMAQIQNSITDFVISKTVSAF